MCYVPALRAQKSKENENERHVKVSIRIEDKFNNTSDILTVRVGLGISEEATDGDATIYP